MYPLEIGLLIVTSIYNVDRAPAYEVSKLLNVVASVPFVTVYWMPEEVCESDAVMETLNVIA